MAEERKDNEMTKKEIADKMSMKRQSHLRGNLSDLNYTREIYKPSNRQIIKLPKDRFKREQALSVTNYYTSVDGIEPLITVSKNEKTIATFYTKGEQIYLRISDRNLCEILADKGLSYYDMQITDLELDKKLDIRVKGLGGDMGLLFSAFGYQLKGKDNLNIVNENKDYPFDIDVSEKFVDMAVKNHFQDSKDKHGCLLGDNMNLDSPTMQGILRSVIANEPVYFDSVISKTLGDENDESKQVKLFSTSYQFDGNGAVLTRPMDFMEMGGKPYVYLSVKDNETGEEHAGRFYEITGVSVTKDDRIMFRIKDKSLTTVNRDYPNSRTIEIPYNHDKNGSRAFVNFVKDMANNEKYQQQYLDKYGTTTFNNPSFGDFHAPNATLTNRLYGMRDNWIQRDTTQVIHNFDSAGFVRGDSAEDVFGEDYKNAQTSNEAMGEIYRKQLEKEREEERLRTERRAEQERLRQEQEKQASGDYGTNYENTAQATAQNYQPGNNYANYANISEPTAEQEEVFSANLAVDPDAGNPPNEADGGDPSAESDSNNADREREQTDPAAKQGDSAGEQPSPEAEQTPEPQPAPETPPVAPEPEPEPEPAPAPEPMPETPEAPSRDDAQGATSGAPNGAPAAVPAENENGRPKKRSVLDVPYAEDTTLKDYDPDKSNALAAKIGLGILGPSILIFFISAIVGIPLLGLIANAGMALATVTFTKPWEWARISKSNAIARANAKLAKEKVKELKRERKAENKKEGTATLTEEEKEARKNKQLTEINAEQEKIAKDDENINDRIAALNEQQSLLLAGGAILDENGNPITLTDEELEEIGNQSEFLQRVDTDPELYQTVYKEINEGKEKGEERTPTINDYIAHWNKKIAEKEGEISEASRKISNRSVNVLASVGELRSAAGEDKDLQEAVRLMYSNALHGGKLERLRAGVDAMDETARQAEIEKEEKILTENNKKLKDMEDERTIGLKLVTFHNLRDNYEKSEEERKQAIADKAAREEELAKLKNERELLKEKRLNDAIGAEPSFADQFRQELYKQNQQQLEYLKARQGLNGSLRKNLEKQAERIEKGKDVEHITKSQTTNFERTDAILDMQTGDGNEIVNKQIAQEQKEYEEARARAQIVLDWVDDINKKREEATLANDTDALNKLKEKEEGVLAYTDDLVKGNSDQIKARFETLQQTVYSEFGRELPQEKAKEENGRRAKTPRNKDNSATAGGEGREVGRT